MDKAIFGFLRREDMLRHNAELARLKKEKGNYHSPYPFETTHRHHLGVCHDMYCLACKALHGRTNTGGPPIKPSRADQRKLVDYAKGLGWTFRRVKGRWERWEYEREFDIHPDHRGKNGWVPFKYPITIGARGNFHYPYLLPASTQWKAAATAILRQEHIAREPWDKAQQEMGFYPGTY